MIYRFTAENENIYRIGGVDANDLEVTLQRHLDSGERLATAEEFDAQLLGPLNKRIVELEARVAELEKPTLEKTAE